MKHHEEDLENLKIILYALYLLQPLCDQFLKQREQRKSDEG